MTESTKSSTSSGNTNRTGHRQSPINFDKTTAIPKICPPIVLTNYAEAGTKLTLINTGHTVEIRPSIDSPGAFLSGGPLKDRYKFFQFHFHWGSNDAMGSEHSIDGNFYSMEAHFVHYNDKYPSIEVSIQKPDGLAVVAVFFQLNGRNEHDDNPVIAGITNHLRSVQKVGTTADILLDVLAWVKDFCVSSKEYYTYDGSLTTPPFTENVTWLIFPVPVELSKRQIDLFRQLTGSEGGPIAANHRQLQSLNDRQVYVVRMKEDREAEQS